MIFVAHIARVFAEGAGILRNPVIISTSILSGAMAVWALILLIRRPS